MGILGKKERKMTQSNDQSLVERPLVRWFAQQMERVLRENDHKQGCDKMDHWEIHWRISEEYEELTQVLSGARDGNAIDEAVDVANFCAFLAYNLYQRTQGIYLP